jgi:hypothetical protein
MYTRQDGGSSIAFVGGVASAKRREEAEEREAGGQYCRSLCRQCSTGERARARGK